MGTKPLTLCKACKTELETMLRAAPGVRRDFATDLRARFCRRVHTYRLRADRVGRGISPCEPQGTRGTFRQTGQAPGA